MTIEKFNCNGCGLCCRNVDKSFLTVDFDRGDGVCKNLNLETNLCKIYYQRPIVCNVDAYYDKFLSNLMSREDFHNLNYKVCEKLKKREGLIPPR